ncbi:trichohyalin isoform X2 [Pieris rapae]|uniref:trichohyalin isoform X2 n=1 Tax=Pieris rapae TaxID=64459 RepID=UPI001E27DC2A|nr:trichohyalin isoform X2 [Pieris rapae]
MYRSERYLGLPVMLKAGEYSPNNPLLRGERSSGDVLLGLGEYERRRNTLRKIRQRQYKEYLDEQAKIKQEEREKAEREKKEREEKERLAEERERERERLELERERYSPERRRASFTSSNVSGANNAYNSKVDTAVQVDRHRPLSVAVQTDDNDFFPTRTGISLPSKQLLTQAERELSPRTVGVKPATWSSNYEDRGRRRRSYGDFDARTSSNTDKQTYRPSILDADVISLRNLQAEKEAAARRQFYQQELRNQIEEQQRIKEERKNREKMLEQAEMRRLEQQLRSLKMAQESEIDRHRDINSKMQRNSAEYDMQRTSLQQEIDEERSQMKRHTDTNSYFEKPYTVNVPDTAIFSPNYDLENYLRKNLNPTKESLRLGSKRHDNWKERENWYEETPYRHEVYDYKDLNENRQIANEKVKSDKCKVDTNRYRQASYRSEFDTLPIPVLRHSPKHQVKEEEKYEKNELSEEMQLVDDKWKVPAVQKNILKNLKSEGRNINILTQLGSIRRQLQLEQMKLDKIKQTDF